MGLQGQLNDVASDSIPLYLVALFATCVNHLYCVFLNLLPSSTPNSQIGTLSDHLSLNRTLSYPYIGRITGSDCVFCLTGIKDGDLIRNLSCRHVFHKVCFDGWLHQFKFTCPLCRSPVR